jgi:hypothetical protein
MCHIRGPSCISPFFPGIAQPLNISCQIVNIDGELPYNEYNDQYLIVQAIREDEKPSTMPGERRDPTLSAIWDLLEESWGETRPSAEEFRDRLKKTAVLM